MIELILLKAALVFYLMNSLHHRATKPECDAEYWLELSAMNSVGIYGDPPITMGNGEYYYDHKSKKWNGISMNPCSYVDNGTFSPRYTKFEKGKETEISKCEYYRLQVKMGWKCVEGDCWDGCKVD